MTIFQAAGSNMGCFMKITISLWIYRLKSKIPFFGPVTTEKGGLNVVEIYIQTCFEALTALTNWPCLHKIKSRHESGLLPSSHFPSVLLPVCLNWFSAQKMYIWFRKNPRQGRCSRAVHALPHLYITWVEWPAPWTGTWTYTGTPRAIQSKDWIWTLYIRNKDGAWGKNILTADFGLPFKSLELFFFGHFSMELSSK